MFIYLFVLLVCCVSVSVWVWLRVWTSSELSGRASHDLTVILSLFGTCELNYAFFSGFLFLLSIFLRFCFDILQFVDWLNMKQRTFVSIILDMCLFLFTGCVFCLNMASPSSVRKANKRQWEGDFTVANMDRAYKFKILLPNGSTVELTVRDPRAHMPFEDFVKMVKDEYFEAWRRCDSMKAKRPIKWHGRNLYVEDAYMNVIRESIDFEMFKPHKCHILKLYVSLWCSFVLVIMLFWLYRLFLHWCVIYSVLLGRVWWDGWNIWGLSFFMINFRNRFSFIVLICSYAKWRECNQFCNALVLFSEHVGFDSGYRFVKGAARRIHFWNCPGRFNCRCLL